MYKRLACVLVTAALVGCGQTPVASESSAASSGEHPVPTDLPQANQNPSPPQTGPTPRGPSDINGPASC